MNYSEIVEMSQRYQNNFAIAQLAAAEDGSDGEIYACTGDSYFPSMEFMSRSQVENHKVWCEEEDPNVSHDNIWDAVQRVDLHN